MISPFSPCLCFSLLLADLLLKRQAFAGSTSVLKSQVFQAVLQVSTILCLSLRNPALLFIAPKAELLKTLLLVIGQCVIKSLRGMYIELACFKILLVIVCRFHFLS